MKCAACGSEVPEGGAFCPACGMIAADAIRVDDPRLSAPRGEIKAAVAARESTDRIVSTSWIALPIVLIVLSYIAIPIAVYFLFQHLWTSGPTGESQLIGGDVARDVLAVMATIFLFPIVTQIFYAWMAFRLVGRQQAHFGREKALRVGVMKLLRSAAWSTARMRIASPEIMTLEQSEARGSIRSRDPHIWALIVALPAIGISLALVGFLLVDPETTNIAAALALVVFGGLIAFIGGIMTLYMFYFLGKEMQEHDLKWASFIFLSRRAMSKLGFPHGGTYSSIQLPDRSFVLYLVLSFFFFPFIYYWWYALMKDPNEHFRRQWEFEDHLLVATGQWSLGKGAEAPTSASTR